MRHGEGASARDAIEERLERIVEREWGEPEVDAGADSPQTISERLDGLLGRERDVPGDESATESTPEREQLEKQREIDRLLGRDRGLDDEMEL